MNTLKIRKLKTCLQCLLPESAPGISFDDSGICNYCRTYKKTELNGEEALLNILDRQRRRGGKFQCLVPLSGGRDSTFALLKMSRDYGLNVLAVNYQNPFTAPEAVRNIRQATEKLGVALVSFGLKPGLHQMTLKKNLEAWLKRPSAALVPIICSACHNMWMPIIRIAKQHHIHCIVTGRNPYEEVSFKRRLLGVSPDEDIRNIYLKNLGGIVKEAAKNLSYFSPQTLPVMIQGHFFGSPYALGTRLYGRGIEMVDLFFYLPWNESEVLARIQNELGWQSPREKGNTWRFDCRVSPLRDLMYQKTIGMTERQELYARLIREGLATKDDVAKRLETENVIHHQQISQLLEEVGIRDRFFSYEGV